MAGSDQLMCIIFMLLISPSIGQTIINTLEPSEIIANEGRNASTTCEILPFGSPRIEMRAVGEAQFGGVPAGRLEIELVVTPEGENNRTRFIFLNVARREDGTQFRCVYGASTLSNIATLDVIFAPEYIEEPGDQVVREGNDFSLSITLDPGNPEAVNFQWQFNGNNISSDTRITLTRNSIMITGVQRSEDGIYSVTTHNSVGPTTVDFELDVQWDSPFELMPNTTHTAIMAKAQFDCRVRAHAVGWFLDGSFANTATLVQRNASYTVQQLPDGTFESTFNILATHENNNSRVECEVFIVEVGIITSDTAILLVQGLLAAPNDFQVHQRGGGFIVLHWSHPFTLEGVPIVCFTIYWRNLDTNEVGNISLPHNVSSVNLTIDDLSPAQPIGVKYEFHISATNGAGEGCNSSTEQGYFQNETMQATTSESAGLEPWIIIAVTFLGFLSSLLICILVVLLICRCCRLVVKHDWKHGGSQKPPIHQWRPSSPQLLPSPDKH